MNEIGSGFFLQFSDEEIKEVHAFCVENRYVFDKDGFKKAFMDMIRDEDLDPDRNPILDALEKNPEIITKVGQATANILSKFLNRKKAG